MTDRRFQIILMSVAALLAITLTVIKEKLQQPASSSLQTTGSSEPLPATASEGPAKEKQQEIESSNEPPILDLTEPTPPVEPPASPPPERSDEFSIQPVTLDLEDGQSRDLFAGRVVISTQFRLVAGHDVATVVVILPDGGTERFPFTNAGDERSFKLDGITYNATLLSVDWSFRRIRLRVS